MRRLSRRSKASRLRRGSDASNGGPKVRIRFPPTATGTWLLRLAAPPDAGRWRSITGESIRWKDSNPRSP